MTMHDDDDDLEHKISTKIESAILDNSRIERVKEYSKQAQKLASKTNVDTDPIHTVEAKFVTPLDPVLETADGKRLPTIPVAEAAKLNRLKNEAQGNDDAESPPESTLRESKDGTAHGSVRADSRPATANEAPGAPLREAVPPSRTNPLFPPLPIYGPPSLMRTAQCSLFRVSSTVLSFCFLLVIVIGAIVDAIPHVWKNSKQRTLLRDPRKQRPFYQEEEKRRQERRAAEKAWESQHRGGPTTPSSEKGASSTDNEFVPTEGGPDPLLVDVAYYARRVGLDAEVFEVQTEDGFIIELWHIFNPAEYQSPAAEARGIHGPDIFCTPPAGFTQGQTQQWPDGRKRYPILMMHGLLQSAGAFCCNDDDSLAFYLAKSGYDVWLGNNRCGFKPRHTSLRYGDPRMWAWNIRQMGVMDLPALVSRVLGETGFPKLALIAHSQGTTQSFVALAKEQRPDIGEKISVFCALAPAAYAGPLVQRLHFKFMQLISPSFFRLVFGIHAFIPLMMVAHDILPAKGYSWMGYHVFAYLFNWSDSRWDRGLRNRMFQFAPVYTSAEALRWWLGRECFAKHRCILSTRREGNLEDKEDEEDDEIIRQHYINRETHIPARRKLQRSLSSFHCQTLTHKHHDSTRGKYAWYNEQFPPLALWVCGADDLVDGRRLLRRFDRGREPHVRIVHKKIIEGYEHLDVIWAMDAIEKVGKEVREVIWRTTDLETQKKCRVPVGCTKPVEENPDDNDVPMLHSGGRKRMQSISELIPPSFPRTYSSNYGRTGDANGQVQVDASKGFEEEQEKYEQKLSEVDELAAQQEQQADDAVFTRRLSEAHFRDVEERQNPLG